LGEIADARNTRTLRTLAALLCQRVNAARCRMSGFRRWVDNGEGTMGVAA
jgi:hypothetical protein